VDLDYVLTGSQKALALPPGLAFCTANERIMERAQASTMRGLYRSRGDPFVVEEAPMPEYAGRVSLSPSTHSSSTSWRRG
jgi:hypothetical protein